MTVATALRPGLPPPPNRIARLPVDARGYPVPWFVVWLDDEKVCDPGTGTPDFRVTKPNAVTVAVRFKLCWTCGQPTGSLKAFPVGPMCGLNRTSSEPPSHTECARWAAQACPFLTRPHMRRRENDLPDHDPPAGLMLARNPGVVLLWVTRRFTLTRVPERVAALVQGAKAGALVKMGDPAYVEWWSEGRPATRPEVVAAIDEGLPTLMGFAEAQGPFAVRELERRRTALLDLAPKDAA